jgi:hypothetical protein
MLELLELVTGTIRPPLDRAPETAGPGRITTLPDPRTRGRVVSRVFDETLRPWTLIAPVPPAPLRRLD